MAGEEEKLPVRLSLPLAYQQEIFFQVRDKDGLLILARGLGLLRVVANVLHAYDVAGNGLILLIGADDRENGWLGETMAAHAALSHSAAAGSDGVEQAQQSNAAGLTIINTDMMSVRVRAKSYAKGGVYSITSRILIVDFLSGLLDPTKVSGIAVLHAEKVVETSLDAFILRIYRQKNKIGFLKAFSDSPESFSSGFNPLGRMMKNLQLTRSFLYPRFQVTVAESVEGKKKAEVIELEVEMTTAMQTIQIAILECIETSISELKKGNPGLEMDDWNVDSALHRHFDTVVRRQLDPVWHRTSFRTRQIVRDLSLLRTMLQAMLSYDCVTFLKYLDTIRAASAPPPGTTRHNQPVWMMLDAAETVFSLAKSRVYTGRLAADVPIEQQNGLLAVLEEQPKWALLAEILDEIDQELLGGKAIGASTSNQTILIMCEEQATCAQVREYLQTMNIPSRFRQPDDQDDAGDGKDRQSGQVLLNRRLRNYVSWKRDFSRFSASLQADAGRPTQAQNQGQAGSDGPAGFAGRAPPMKRRRVRGGGSVGATSVGSGSGRHTPTVHTADRESDFAAVFASLNQADVEEALTLSLVELDGDAQPHQQHYDQFDLFDMADLVIVHPYDGDVDEQILEETKPTYIIMYDPDAAFIRRVEAYRSSHSGRNVRVYFMYYKHSVEEQRYLSIVRREKDSFTRLIQERASMGITINHQLNDQQSTPEDGFLRSLNTRVAGGGLTITAAAAAAALESDPRRVIVDVREFRSSLPSLIHSRNIQIIPAMLTVGDYILSPDLCVERKSIKDLIGSLNNGRIYHQAEWMIRHYKHAILLIEFDRDKAFTLEMFADLSVGPAIGVGLGIGSAGINVGSHARSSVSTIGNGKSDGDLQSKLVLLTIAFPALRIVWTSSSHQSAQLIDEMKRSECEPDPVRAVEIGIEDDVQDGKVTGKGRNLYAQVPEDMLLALPGLSLRAARLIQDNVRDVATLTNMKEDELAAIIGHDPARQVVRFFERTVIDE